MLWILTWTVRRMCSTALAMPRCDLTCILSKADIVFIFYYFLSTICCSKIPRFKIVCKRQHHTRRPFWRISLAQLSAWASYKKQNPDQTIEQFAALTTDEQCALICEGDVLESCRDFLSQKLYTHLSNLGGVEEMWDKIGSSCLWCTLHHASLVLTRDVS